MHPLFMFVFSLCVFYPSPYRFPRRPVILMKRRSEQSKVGRKRLSGYDCRIGVRNAVKNKGDEAATFSLNQIINFAPASAQLVL